MNEYGVWVTCEDGFAGWSMEVGRPWKGSLEQAESLARLGRIRFPGARYEVLPFQPWIDPRGPKGHTHLDNGAGRCEDCGAVLLRGPKGVTGP